MSSRDGLAHDRWTDLPVGRAPAGAGAIPGYPSGHGHHGGIRSTPSPEANVFSFLKRLSGPQIDVAELDALLTQGVIRVLDVREDSEFKGGHLPGAIHVPVKRLPDRVAKLKRDKPYAVICASGSRSKSATAYLLDQGFEGTVSVRGGTGAWERSGRPLIR
jgi:rhodanese-related sulfurtransferase